MDSRIIVEGNLVEINVNDLVYDNLCETCHDLNTEEISRVLVTGNCTNPDLPLFFSVLLVHFPHVTVEAMMDEVPPDSLIHYIWENDLDIEWWIRA